MVLLNALKIEKGSKHNRTKAFRREWPLVGRLALVCFGFFGSLNTLALVNTKILKDTYLSPEQALSAMAEKFLVTSRRRDAEYVGGLLRLSTGEIQVTSGFGGRGEDSVGFSVPKARGVQIIAFWHTHGDFGYARERFSATDAEMVRSTGKPLYLITPSGEIRVLRPEDVNKYHKISGLSRRESGLSRQKIGYSGVRVARK